MKNIPYPEHPGFNCMPIIFIIFSTYNSQRAVHTPSDWDRTCVSQRFGSISCVSKVTICLAQNEPGENAFGKLRNLFGDLCVGM